ncbi:hypothetical protein F2P81_008291 [Scophthalmus maximus]|uniref:Uncharacterized protein n=1 Tax=Scophthalmus maximus TaxID=52904 RepID=A0A6A4SXU6_SCOMX|nr:hypothetical protein F2P81_008291 [Scophthalmus maximus]
MLKWQLLKPLFGNYISAGARRYTSAQISLSVTSVNNDHTALSHGECSSSVLLFICASRRLGEGGRGKTSAVFHQMLPVSSSPPLDTSDFGDTEVFVWSTLPKLCEFLDAI